jgi:hypothetical protein
VRTRSNDFGLAAALSLALGLFGWLPLALSAGLAQGDASNTAIAAALGTAGAASLLGFSLGILGWRRSSALILQVVSGVGVFLSGVLGLVVFIFAVSFHW